MGQHGADLAFHKQGYELSDLRVVEPGMHGLDDPCLRTLYQEL